MKHLIAALLRHRTAWQLVAIAAVLTAGGLLIVYNTYRSTRETLQPLLVVMFATAAVALILAIVRRGEQAAREGVPARWGRFSAVVLGLCAGIAFVTYSFGHYRTHMVAGCNASVLPSLEPQRRAALAAAEAALRSPFAVLPALLDDEAARECARSRADLERVERGMCTRWPLEDRSCACGDERYPYERCDEPNCLYAPGLPDRFDCVGDPPIPDGYLGH